MLSRHVACVPKISRSSAGSNHHRNSSTVIPPHLFQTNDPPTESERTYIWDQINVTRSQREVLFETIKPRFLSAEPDKEYLENLAKLFLLDEFIYNHQCLLSPLRYFPPELLAEILFALPYKRVFETDLEVAVWEPDYQYILGLSQVSRYWRKVALATQGLWTSIPALRKWQSDAPEPESVLQHSSNIQEMPQSTSQSSLMYFTT